MKQIFQHPATRLIVGVLAVVACYVAVVQVVYAGKIVPGIESGSLSLGGKTVADAEAAIDSRAKSLQEIRFAYRGQTFTVLAAEVGFKPDAAATARAARDANDGQGLLAPLGTAIGQSVDVPLRFSVDESALRAKLAELAKPFTDDTGDAEVVRDGTDFRIKAERSGAALDIDDALAATRASLGNWGTTTVLAIREYEPAIRARDLVPARAYAELLSGNPLTLTLDDRRFQPDDETLADWVTFVPGPEQQLPPVLRAEIREAIEPLVPVALEQPVLSKQNKTVRATIDRAKAASYLDGLAGDVNDAPVNARLTVTNGVVALAQPDRPGRAIDKEPAVSAVAEATKRTDRTVALPVTTRPADIRAETLAKLGLTGLIGSSTTTFGGSPVNRTFNIGVGADKFDGILVKPGEEFSFNKYLGEVGPETGYRPELVILENRTEPQYGGGLCQVSTTAFRAALNAGLPITDRTNHSYAVHYYAPIGMDATIYPPNPDMKFKNNTKGHILIQTSTAGQSLTFQFFGTPDDRKSSTEIIHISATEAGGGTASFRYTVEGGPEPINRVFSSSYKPQSAFPISRSLN